MQLKLQRSQTQATVAIRTVESARYLILTKIKRQVNRYQMIIAVNWGVLDRIRRLILQLPQLDIKAPETAVEKSTIILLNFLQNKSIQALLKKKLQKLMMVTYTNSKLQMYHLKMLLQAWLISIKIRYKSLRYSSKFILLSKIQQCLIKSAEVKDKILTKIRKRYRKKYIKTR